MEKKNKIIISGVVGLTLLGMAFGEDTEKEDKSKAIDNKKDTEIKETINNNQIDPDANNNSVENDTNNDTSDKIEIDEKQSNENNVNDYNQDNNKTSPEESETNNSTSSNNSANSESTSSEQLPLKAICNDGTISYQDNANKPDYRGMCSGHKGIKTKLGRVK